MIKYTDDNNLEIIEVCVSCKSEVSNDNKICNNCAQYWYTDLCCKTCYDEQCC